MLTIIVKCLLVGYIIYLTPSFLKQDNQRRQLADNILYFALLFGTVGVIVLL